MRRLSRCTPFPALLGWTLLISTLLLAGCGASLRYPHSSSEEMAQAWQDAFNRDEQDQLRLLVHPDRRETFDGYAKDVEVQLSRYTILRYTLGKQVPLTGGQSGQEITFYMADGAAEPGAEPIDNASVIVQSGGRWWLWRY